MIIKKALNEHNELYRRMKVLESIYIEMQDKISDINTSATSSLRSLIYNKLLPRGQWYKLVSNDDRAECLKTVKQILEDTSILIIRDSYDDAETMKQCDLDLNNLYRVAHDITHLAFNLTTSVKDEIKVILFLCLDLVDKCSDSTAAVYHAIDFYLQVLYYRDNKEFMRDQYSQVLDMLNNVGYVNELLTFIDSFDSSYFDRN